MREAPHQEAGEWPLMDQETQVEEMLQRAEKLMKKAEKQGQKSPDKMYATLKEVTAKLKEAKALLKEFEREARADGMPTEVLSQRKKAMGDKLNALIERKKQVAQEAQRDDLFAGAAQPLNEENVEEMSVQQLMTKGRRQLAETDAALNRAAGIVEDTLQVGTQTAAALGDQTQQLNKIVDDLADIEFNVKKASKVIRDITRGLLTDKCIGFLLFAAIAGVICIIVLKVVNPRKKNISEAISSAVNTTALTDQLKDAAGNLINGASPSPALVSGRRLLREPWHDLVQSATQEMVTYLLQDNDI